MKIGIDVRCLATGKRTGVEEYTISLLEELFANDTENDYVLFANAWHGDIAHLAWAQAFPHVHIMMTRYPNKLLNFSLWYFKRPYLDRLIGGVDVFFVPNIGFGAFSRDTKVVLTVHDLSFEHSRSTFSLKRRLWHFFVHPRRLTQRADHIIAVSHATRDDLIETYRVPDRKVGVVHNGVEPLAEIFATIDARAIDDARGAYALPQKYILYFGTIEPRKNIITVIRAYEQLRYRHQEYQEMKLVLAGGRGWKSSAIYDAIKKSHYKDDIIVTGVVTQEEKTIIFGRAHVVVYPSHFEGFGFPALEGLAAHVPVITSFTTSLPEIVADRALMINPDSGEEVYRALHMTLSDRTLYARLAQDRDNIAEIFSWTHTARNTQKTFTSLTQQKLL